MSEKPTFSIWVQLEPYSGAPYRLTETRLTSDGYRTRFCDGAFATRDDAISEKLKREGKIR